MAEWKKVIVSGSTANLAALQVDNLTSGQVVIGGGASNLSTTAINGTGNIVATTGASGLVHSGSFSGSFQGDGSELTGVTATAIFPTTAKTDLADTDQFFINDGANKYVTYGNLLTDLAGTNLAVEGTDSLTLASQIAVTGISASFTGSLTGALIGTASYATQALSSSYALTASFYGGSVISASYALTASYVQNALTASNITPAITNNVNNYVLTATGDNPNGEQNLQFDGTTLTVTGNEVVTGNLTVQGTASFQHTSNLEVADRFILLASGSNAGGDGGIVIQMGIQNEGQLFGYENSINRWGFTSSFNASSPNFTAVAMVTTTERGTVAPTVAPIYGNGGLDAVGNIYVNTNTSDIYIYA
jgi:hypothetical protein